MHNIYLATLLTIFLYMIFWFVLAQIKKDNGIIDIGWGLGFVTISLVTFFLFGSELPGQSILVLLIAVWGIRLAAYILVRGLGQPEDWRYKKWRKDWGKNVVVIAFFRVFMLQGAFMFIVSLPILSVMGSSSNRQFIGWEEVVGVGIWLLGFLWESISDQQLYNFKKDPANKGKVMTKGLWAYSRHPNYFGEILLWWGIFILAIPYGNWYISLIGTVAITWLISRVSGVPFLERRYKDDEEYQAYKKRTNALIPRFW